MFGHVHSAIIPVITQSIRVNRELVPVVDDQQRIDVAAYTMLINSLFNLDIVKTRE